MPKRLRRGNSTVVSRNMEAYLKLVDAAQFDKDLTAKTAQEAMLEAYTDDIEVVEPPSLPHHGVHKGKENWLKMNNHMGSLWDQKVFVNKMWEVPEEDLIVLYTNMEWTAKATGKTAKFPAIELLYFRDAKICKVELFLWDTKLCLDTLEA